MSLGKPRLRATSIFSMDKSLFRTYLDRTLKMQLRCVSQSLRGSQLLRILFRTSTRCHRFSKIEIMTNEIVFVPSRADLMVIGKIDPSKNLNLIYISLTASTAPGEKCQRFNHIGPTTSVFSHRHSSPQTSLRQINAERMIYVNAYRFSG